MKYEKGFDVYSDIILHLSSAPDTLDFRLQGVCKNFLQELRSEDLPEKVNLNLQLIKNNLQYPSNYEEIILESKLEDLTRIIEKIFMNYKLFSEIYYSNNN